MIKLTIITINYNNASGLYKTIQSVFNQIYSDFEYVIIDGASTDGSQEVITQYFNFQNNISLAFISEQDNGIYHAMNKGIRLAKGEYIHFLNSGDWLVDDMVVENMIEQIDVLKANNTIPDIYVGNKITIRADGKIRKSRNDKMPITALTFYRGTIEHTSTYIRRDLFDKYGLYDESLRIVSDWKWYLQAVILHNAKVCFSNTFVSYFDNTGISSTNLDLDKYERRKVLEELLPQAVLADYDRYHFHIDQIERLKRYPIIYKVVWFVERVLFKFDKWNMKYWSWKKR